MEKKKLGLALSGGGARGFAHIGALKAFEENNIPIDIIAGTSAGSFVAAAFASGMAVDQIIHISKKLKWSEITNFSYSHRGFLTNVPIGKFIAKNFPTVRIEDLKIPYSAVACDLATGDEIVFQNTGDLTLAVRASCAVPGVFVPVDDENGRQLIDGGVISPIPTRTVKKMGADIIIAVDLLTCGVDSTKPPKNLIGTFMQSAMMLIANASRNQHFRADVIIEPQIAHIRPDEIKKMDDLIKLGHQAANEKIEEIITLLDQSF